MQNIIDVSMSTELFFLDEEEHMHSDVEATSSTRYLNDISYPLSLDSVGTYNYASQSFSDAVESEDEYSCFVNVESSNDDVESSSDEEAQSSESTGALEPRSKRPSRMRYSSGPKDPVKNEKERARNVRKGELLGALRDKIVQSGIHCEAFAGEEKRMTEESTLKFTIEVIEHLKRLIRQRGGDVANCKSLAPLAAVRYSMEAGESNQKRSTKPSNKFFRFMQVKKVS